MPEEPVDYTFHWPREAPPDRWQGSTNTPRSTNESAAHALEKVRQLRTELAATTGMTNSELARLGLAPQRWSRHGEIQVSRGDLEQFTIQLHQHLSNLERRLSTIEHQVTRTVATQPDSRWTDMAARLFDRIRRPPEEAGRHDTRADDLFRGPSEDGGDHDAQFHYRPMPKGAAGPAGADLSPTHLDWHFPTERSVVVPRGPADEQLLTPALNFQARRRALPPTPQPPSSEKEPAAAEQPRRRW